MKYSLNKFIRAVAMGLGLAHSHQVFALDPPSSAGSAASGTESKVSAEQIKRVLDRYSNASGPVLKTEPTALGELAWIDSDGDRSPDTLALDGVVIVPPRKAENGALYRLTVVDFNGVDDRTTGKYAYRHLLIAQSSFNCQYILMDFTGTEVWVSPRFPDEKEFPGWMTGCVDITWVTWTPPYPLFYFMGPEAKTIFGYNPKLKAVIGPIDPDDAPPHPKCQSLIPQPFGAIEECMKWEREEKKNRAKSQARPKARS